ncbi:hypothetical protein B0J13DRAFT_565776, partial [Dactylonectria estremocensis]
MASEASSLLSTPSSAPDFIDIERFFTREKAKPRALYVCLYCIARPWKDGYKGNAWRYIRNNHLYLMGLSSWQNQSYAFNRQAYIDAIIGLVTRRRVAFSIVEWDELKDRALACNPAIEDSLITSRPVCGQWVDKDYELRKALLGLLECRKDHSGEFQACLIADVLRRFEIRRVALSEKLFHERGIIFDPVRCRIRCFGHIINLSLQAFLLARSKEALRAALNAAGDAAGAQSIETFSTALNENMPSGPDTTVDHTPEGNQGRQQRPRARERTTQQVEFSGWEGVNALRKLHHLAVWLRSSPIHSDNWREAYKVISVALDKKAQVVQFMVDYDKDIGCANLLTGADWDILLKTHTFLQPFTEATLITEGDKASLCSTLQLMDGLLSHFEKAKIYYSTLEFHDTRMLHSIEMGWFVLDKYYTMSDEAPVYNWKIVWINLAIASVRQIWEEEYNININIDGDFETSAEDIPAALGNPPSQLQLLLKEIEIETAVSTDDDNLDAF